MLHIRTYDYKYILILYAYYKLGQLFNVYVNNQLINVVLEDYSLSNFESGTVHFVNIKSKIRKRKLSSSGYWKQNGIENVIKAALPESLIGSKRTLTYQEDKKYKLWEYGLYLNNYQYGYNVLIRHYLCDTVGTPQRYVSGNIKVSIRPKEGNISFSRSDFVIDENDFEVIDSIYYFICNNKFNIIDINMNIYDNHSGILDENDAENQHRLITSK
ncbi:hypothetical protein DICPUDRAFT_93523 [Dictyostelium purpureum]|uniref:Uncharacterized protein n=1 Tax=Dictyostelium purpureum TaxID=5786 RepID=F0Z8I1_DICPU|nr:uncharacterized protein DICPUDRAFT_93523 [Dictyostelium purpureum]EGC39760.1 hypothetical protein DICPUDRAFT_93523 [Dictyostelium purpureum]|eukprot:XP_003283746.1 hypothetical protein DICPUDRAFT_93523 [Dictyostelium purpureum]